MASTRILFPRETGRRVVGEASAEKKSVNEQVEHRKDDKNTGYVQEALNKTVGYDVKGESISPQLRAAYDKVCASYVIPENFDRDSSMGPRG
jgi:hypothetical protein